MTGELPAAEEPEMGRKDASQVPEPAKTEMDEAASTARKSRSGAGRKAPTTETIRELERKNKELLVRVRELELDRVGGPEREYAEHRSSSWSRPGQDRMRPEGEDRPDEPALIGRGFAATAPLRFALHAAFYYAGRAADKIVAVYSKAFKLDREYVADFNKSTGVALAGHGHWDRAIPLLEKALGVTPDDQNLLLQLAKAYGATEQYERACQCLEDILETSPDSARALRALGFIYSRQQNHERAIEYLERALELDPDHAQARYRLGAAYDHRKRYDQAVESFKKAIALDPRLAKAYQAMGFTYESMGDRESAVECFKKALQLE